MEQLQIREAAGKGGKLCLKIGEVECKCSLHTFYITRARESIAELTSQIAEATTKLADTITGGMNGNGNHAIYERMQELEQQVDATEQALSLGFDSLRLNPWARSVRSQIADYPEVLTAINRIVRQLRRIAYTVNDVPVPWRVIVHEQEWAQVDAQLLRSISGILAWIAHSLSTFSTTTSAQDNNAVHANLERKEQVRATLDTAFQQLISCEEALLHNEIADDLVSMQGEDSPLSKGHILSLRGAILTDLRRILQELSEILAVLPPR